MILSSIGIIASKAAAAGGYDADAQAFMTAAGLTNTTQKDALNTLVVSLKASAPTSATLWSKFIALYPMVGGNADAHKFNLKNPVDSNAAYRILFSGSWVHNNLGAIPNASNTYGNTFLNTNVLSQNSASVWYYSRADNWYSAELMGVFDSAGGKNGIQFQLRSGAGGGSYSCIMGREEGEGDGSVNKTGLIGLSRIVSTEYKRYGRFAGAVTSATVYTAPKASNTASLVALPIFLAARNVGGTLTEEYTNSGCSFAAIGTGFDAAEAAALNTIVQTYQIALSRNIY
jgi:hypothetical protein